MEQYPCEDQCLQVFGLELPRCFEHPGCAVTTFRGSLDLLSEPIASISPQQAARDKAAAALRAANDIDPHFAGQALAATIRRVRSQAQCFNITCGPAPGPCFHPPSCANGACRAPLTKASGTPCDDGNEETSGDVCDASGVCAGVNLCANVTCAPPGPCEVGGTCVEGDCKYVVVSDGTPVSYGCGDEE